MTINRERLELGLAALRSGQFEQGQGWLKREFEGVTRHCCLGVLCEVAVANGAPVTVQDDLVDVSEGQAVHTAFGGNEYTLPPEVVKWYGFDDENPVVRSLPHDVDDCYQCDNDLPCSDREGRDLIEATSLNDDHNWTFGEIADAFEETFLRAN